MSEVLIVGGSRTFSFPNSDPPPPEYIEQRRRQIEAERQQYGHGAGQDDLAGQRKTLSADTARIGAAGQTEQPRILPLNRYLAEPFAPVEPLIGVPDAALLVREEGIVIAAPGGVGKTAFVTDGAFKLALGLNVLGYSVVRPLRVCILQAEIPGTYYQQRVQQLSEAYSLSDDASGRIHIPIFHKVPDLGTEDGLKILAAVQQESAADVLIIDPYLSFFPNVNENDNGAVRAALDRLKFTVLLPGNCGAAITDHQAKSPLGQEGGNDPRGAGAKRDWCCTLAALKVAKTPDGEHGAFLKLTLDKVRYAPSPRDPLTLHRDQFSGRFELWHRNRVPPERVAELVSETDEGLPKNKLIKLVAQELTLSDRDARALIDKAVAENLLVVEQGKRKAQYHFVGPAYTPATCSETRSTCS